MHLTTTLVDNRYYHHRSTGVNVSLFGYYGVARGHWPMGYYQRSPAEHYEEVEKAFDTEKGDWQGDLAQLADRIGRGFGQVDALFVNSGHWRNAEFTTAEAAEEQMRLLEPLVKGGMKPVWITTTAVLHVKSGEYEGRTREDAGYIAARRLGWPILDKFSITLALAKWADDAEANRGEIWMDRVHFYPYVTEVMSDVTLNMLCAVY